MWEIPALVMLASAAPSDGSYWQMIVTLGGVIAVMAGFTIKREMSRSREISRVKDACAAEMKLVWEAAAKAKDEATKEVKSILQEQIKEMRGHKELASTLIEVLDRKRNQGG